MEKNKNRKFTIFNVHGNLKSLFKKENQGSTLAVLGFRKGSNKIKINHPLQFLCIQIELGLELDNWKTERHKEKNSWKAKNQQETKPHMTPTSGLELELTLKLELENRRPQEK